MFTSGAPQLPPPYRSNWVSGMKTLRDSLSENPWAFFGVQSVWVVLAFVIANMREILQNNARDFVKFTHEAVGRCALA